MKILPPWSCFALVLLLGCPKDEDPPAGDQDPPPVSLDPLLGLVPIGGPLPVRVVLQVRSGQRGLRTPLAAEPVSRDPDVVVLHPDSVTVAVDEAALDMLRELPERLRAAVL